MGMLKNGLFSVFLVALVMIVEAGGGASPLQPEKYIAHAGGVISGVRSSNSLEALDNSYGNGFRFIELDFEWTSDGEIVLIHDWNQMKKKFGAENRQYSLLEFSQLKMIKNLTQLTLRSLATWVEKHPDAYIVTDVKSKNLEALALIAKKYKYIQRQVIPQIYHFEEYGPVKKMGYQNVILTLYQSSYNDNEIVNFSRKHKLLAVTMPVERGLSDLPAKLDSKGIFVYVHTVNDDKQQEQLELKMVGGFYTDLLKPHRSPEVRQK